jgi:transposase InsO family protein
VKFCFIDEHRKRWPVRVMCRVLEVSAAGFYAWRKRPTSRRARSNAELLSEICRVHRKHHGLIGSPTVHSLLREGGIASSRGRVGRLMRAAGIRGRGPTGFVLTTVHAGGEYRAADNELQRRFAPGTVAALVADITALPTREGSLYLAVVISLRSRRVLGYSMSAQLTGNLGIDALKMALERYPQSAGTLHHSDRGGQYVSHAFRALLEKHGLTSSMSRPGNCWDNAVAESFFATLKRELASPKIPETRKAAMAMIFEYIEVYYNRRRPHSSLGYKTPEEYERLLAEAI